MSEYPRTIDLSQPRYDQTTYSGRLQHFSALTNPLNLLASRAQLDDAKALIAAAEAATRADGKKGILLRVASAADEERAWAAKTVVDSTLHPDTGEPILLPFRMSSFVPTNMVIVAGMLRGGTRTPAGIIAWQWINQSVNVGFNYFNANKTAPMNWGETASAYFDETGVFVELCLELVGPEPSDAWRCLGPATFRLSIPGALSNSLI